MDIDKVLGVKLDSIVIDSDYNFDYDDKIFNEKKPKLAGMFCGTHAMSPEYEHFETVEDYERYIELNTFDCIDKYKNQSNNILNFKKIFTPNGEYIVKRKITYYNGLFVLFIKINYLFILFLFYFYFILFYFIFIPP